MGADKQTLGTKVDPELYQEVQEIAEERDTDVSEVVRRLVKRGLDDREWWRHLAPITQEASRISFAFSVLTPILTLFFTDHSMGEAVQLFFIFAFVGLIGLLLTIHFAEDPDELMGGDS